LPSSPFPPSTSSFEEPELTAVEEAFAKGELRVLLGSGVDGEWPPASGPGHDEPEYGALPGAEPDQQPLPDLYKRMAVEVTEQTQAVSEYIASPAADTAAPCLPPATAGEHAELECGLLSVFPTAFLTPALPYDGNLTLDRVKINCSSFTR